jgi:heme-degrading monooxygenase HmoA
MAQIDAVETGYDTLRQVRLNRFVDMEPQLLRESLQQFKAEQLPALERVPGFRTIFFGVDLKKGKAAAITFWESEADLRASERPERAARELALARAGGSLGKGLVDSYGIVLELPAATNQPGYWARLARWDGVRPERMRLALAQFEERNLPWLERAEGFCGLFVGTNRLLGNTLSVSLWATKADLDASLAWERDARSAVESRAGLVPRTVIAESYAVALAPALQHLPSRPAWAASQPRAAAG